MLIEVIVTNVEEAILAEKFGANRLELIHAFEIGGLSPDLDVSSQVCEAVNIPVNIMVRPHGRNFVYDQTDITQIVREIEYLRDYTAANAIVFGGLTKDNRLDRDALERVIDCKRHLKLVFHRAIDVSYDPLLVYKELLAYNEINDVLTSGGADTAANGINVIKQMVNLNSGLSHTEVLAGSGVTIDNALFIVQQTNVKQIHVGTGLRTDGLLDVTKFEKLLSIFKLRKLY